MLEMMVILLVMGILLAITIPIVSTVLQTSGKVDVTYSNIDEQLWLSTTLQRLVRSAVAPRPSVTPSVTDSAPWPSFATGMIDPTSMTFYTNTGTARGPEMVIADCAPATATGKYCKTTATFSVVVYKAEVTPTTQQTFCPMISGTSAKHCIYTTKTYGGKTVTITARTLVSIPHVRNGTHDKTLFSYAYDSEATSPAKLDTVTPADDSIFNTCTAGSAQALFEHCPAGEIQKVSYDLQINQRTTALYGGAQAEDDTGIFVLSPTSEAYDPSVG